MDFDSLAHGFGEPFQKHLLKTVSKQTQMQIIFLFPLDILSIHHIFEYFFPIFLTQIPPKATDSGAPTLHRYFQYNPDIQVQLRTLSPHQSPRLPHPDRPKHIQGQRTPHVTTISKAHEHCAGLAPTQS